SGSDGQLGTPILASLAVCPRHHFQGSFPKTQGLRGSFTLSQTERSASGLARTGEVLSCYTTRKYPKKRTLLAGPAGYLRCRLPLRPASQTRFAQTASLDIPATATLRSAAQKGSFKPIGA